MEKTTLYKKIASKSISVLAIVGFLVVFSPVMLKAQTATTTWNNSLQAQQDRAAQIANKPIGEYTLLEPLPCLDQGQCTNGSVTQVDLLRYLGLMFKIIISLAAVFAVFMIVVGGFQYATTDAINDKKDGKEKIMHALEGLLMVLASYLILYTIDPRLVQFTTIQSLGLSAPPAVSLDAQLGDISLQTLAAVEDKNQQAKSYRALAAEALNNGDTAKADQYNAKANSIEIDVLRTTSEVAVNNAFTKAINEIQHPGSGGPADQRTVDERIAYMDLEYSNQMKALNAKGDIEGVNKLHDEEIYSDQTVNNTNLLNRTLKNYAGDNGRDQKADIANATLFVKNLQNQLPTYSAAISDPVLRAKYVQETQATIDTVKKAIPAGFPDQRLVPGTPQK